MKARASVRSQAFSFRLQEILETNVRDLEGPVAAAQDASSKLDPGAALKLIDLFPSELREFWPEFSHVR